MNNPSEYGKPEVRHGKFGDPFGHGDVGFGAGDVVDLPSLCLEAWHQNASKIQDHRHASCQVFRHGHSVLVTIWGQIDVDPAAEFGLEQR